MEDPPFALLGLVCLAFGRGGAEVTVSPVFLVFFLIWLIPFPRNGRVDM
jgi:hypothetical protein